MTNLYSEPGTSFFKVLKVKAFGKNDRQTLEDAVRNQMGYVYLTSGIIFAVSLIQLEIGNSIPNMEIYRYNKTTKKWEEI